MNNLPSRVEVLMKHLGVNQGQLAKLAGVTSGAVSQWMRNNMNPSAKALSNLQRNRKVNPEWLLDGRGPMILRDIGEYIVDLNNIKDAEARAALASIIKDAVDGTLDIEKLMAAIRLLK